MGESTKIKVSPEQGWPCSVRRFVAPGPGPLQLLNRLQNAEPHPTPLHVAGLGSLVGLHGREGGGLLRRRSHQTVHISICELSTHFLGRRPVTKLAESQAV